MELSTEWVTDFEIEDKNYKKFYKEKVKSIKLYFLYINREQQLFHIKKSNIEIKDTILYKSELIELINKHKQYQNKIYTPLSLLKYNITLEPTNINEYILNDSNFDYLKAERNIQDIPWYDSILFLKSINSLYIVYKETWKTKHTNTKKIYIKTKKLIHRKTKKKKLKD